MAPDAHDSPKSGNSPFPEDVESVTDLLSHVHGDGSEAFERLIPLVYDELRAIAHQKLRSERDSHTLNTTALVHEAFLRLAEQRRVDWKDRTHFFSVAARVMRRVLVDYARRRVAAKRGGARQPVPLDEALLVVDEEADMLVDLDEALSRLASLDPRLARVVELRYFAGLTEAEIADVLGVSPRTVRYDWVKAKGWLYREMSAPPQE